jgi:predicted nucleotide-binding protein
MVAFWSLQLTPIGAGPKTMSTENASLLAEVVACRYVVEDYTKRLDDACTEYYQTGQVNFPNLSRAEDEDTTQQCERVLTHLVSIMPDVMTRWQSIKYPSDQYKEMVERMRDVWVRRRNLLRVAENTLRTNLELNSLSSAVSGGKPVTQTNANLVFIVHGHKDMLKYELAHSLQNAGLAVTILHEQPNKGRTILEKFADHAAEAGFAVILLTADDFGRAKDATDDKLRARQNVVFELGFFCGLLGRRHVCAVYETGVELPSDLHGFAYVEYDKSGLWKHAVAKEISAAGIPVDFSKL